MLCTLVTEYLTQQYHLPKNQHNSLSADRLGRVLNLYELKEKNLKLLPDLQFSMYECRVHNLNVFFFCLKELKEIMIVGPSWKSN
jgi:hypothetical protein